MSNFEEDGTKTSTPIVLLLFFTLVALIVLLVVLYKYLNKETNGEYTVRRIVYKEGGLRDRARGVAVALGTRLGVRLWPGTGPEQDGEEMRDYGDEEGDVGACESTDGCGDQGDEMEKGSNTSDDDTSAERSDGGLSESEATGGAGAGEEKGGLSGEEEGKEEAGEETGLLVTINQLSGSAIWSGEARDNADINVTAL